jgi:hypothetical protein
MAGIILEFRFGLVSVDVGQKGHISTALPSHQTISPLKLMQSHLSILYKKLIARSILFSWSTSSSTKVFSELTRCQRCTLPPSRSKFRSPFRCTCSFSARTLTSLCCRKLLIWDVDYVTWNTKLSTQILSFRCIIRK